MTQTRYRTLSFHSTLGLGVGLLGAALLLWISTSLAQAPNACQLGERDQAAALAEFQTMRERYSATVTHAELTLALRGDQAELSRVLDRIEAREASCCASLQITRARSATGYDVTLSGEGPMVSTLAMILSAASD